jgi:2-methylcitrate dehydratase
VPLLLAKFERNLRSRLSSEQVDRILTCCSDQNRLERLPVHEFVALFVP